MHAQSVLLVVGDGNERTGESRDTIQRERRKERSIGGFPSSVTPRITHRVQRKQQQQGNETPP